MELSLLLKRREEREFVFLILFENDFNNYDLNLIIDHKKEADAPYFELTDFIKDIFCGVKHNQIYIDELISKHSLKWGKDRISKVSINILRLAVYEILFRNDIPKNVSINEAVELAKKYGEDSEPSFINGILGSLCKSVENND